MTSSVDRRRLLRGAPAGAVGLAVLAGALGTAGVASAAPEAEAGAIAPAGTWTFDIRVPSRPLEHSLYALTRDGIVVHVSNNGLIGLGSWQHRGTGFVIGFREWLTDDNGVVEGSIHVKLTCVPAGKGVRANGIVAGFDLNGTKNFEGTSTGTGVRYGIEI